MPVDPHALRIAYADPPYIGQAKKHYGRDGDPFGGEVGEVDHVGLIAHLEQFDAWALSASAPSLRTILPMCPPEARTLVWVKPFGAYKRNVRVAYVWEPVIVVPAPRREGNVPTRDFCFDSEVVSESITMKRGLAGAKPERFCFWLFNVLGAMPGDELSDLFPGTGAVTAAWEKWCGLGGPKMKQSVKTTNTLEGRVTVPVDPFPNTPRNEEK